MGGSAGWQACAWHTPRVLEVPLNVTINLGFNSSLLGAGFAARSPVHWEAHLVLP